MKYKKKERISDAQSAKASLAVIPKPKRTTSANELLEIRCLCIGTIKILLRNRINEMSIRTLLSLPPTRKEDYKT